VPALLSALEGSGRVLGQCGVALLCLGFTGLGGFAFLLVLVRSLVVTETISAAGLEEIAREQGLTVFLGAWLGAFALGELLLAAGYLRSGTAVVPRWIPVLLLLHVAALPVAAAARETAPVVTALLVLALCGLGIRVAQPTTR
jgi:hypothetical protein